jgi:hypothetical protein
MAVTGRSDLGPVGGAREERVHDLTGGWGGRGRPPLHERLESGRTERAVVTFTDLVENAVGHVQHFLVDLAIGGDGFL